MRRFATLVAESVRAPTRPTARRPAPRGAPAAPHRHGRRGLRGNDVLAIFGINALLVVVMWVRHGGLDNLGAPGDLLTATGQITALAGTYAALVQIVLMSRNPWLESLFGMRRLARWHRVLGFATVVLICAHVVFTTAGYALGDHTSAAHEAWTLVSTYPWMLMATAGTALLVLIAVTSVRAARQRLRHETWHFVHLYAYLAIALSFGHQLAVGSDFSDDPVARGYWVALYAGVIASVVAFRVVAPLRLSRHHDLRVERVVEEAPGVVSIYVGGRDLAAFPARAGQYFLWRFMTGDRWWHAHPFSLSAPPNGDHLRLTVRAVGEHTHTVGRLKPGTRVVVEGPYGVFTARRRNRPRVLLVAGGIGITPLRAMLDEMPRGKGAVTLLYRARSWEDVIFREELETLVREHGGTVHYIVGRRGAEVHADPFAPRFIRQAVPDVQQRDVFICGPASMEEAVQRSLEHLGVPRSQIHREHFAYL
jgi:predicted ferric reductase